MAKPWAALSSLQRAAIFAIGSVDAGLRLWALTDLARRPNSEITGGKWLWGAALAAVNSAGLLPTLYLRWARHAADR